VRIPLRSPRSQEQAVTQETALRTWARAEGHSLITIMYDQERGGLGGLERRRGLHEALAAVTDRRASGLVVARLEVLDGEAAIQEAIFALVVRHNGDVYTCDGGAVSRETPADPARRTLRQAVSAFTRLDQSVRAAQSRARRRRKAMRGGYTGGAPAFGYRVERHELVTDASERAAIARIAELRRAGASYRAMARILAEEGFQPKRSDRWHPESLRRIVQRLAIDS
jgi:DNA invertase Pin-like site-specific DNA recombinase